MGDDSDPMAYRNAVERNLHHARGRYHRTPERLDIPPARTQNRSPWPPSNRGHANKAKRFCGPGGGRIPKRFYSSPANQNNSATGNATTHEPRRARPATNQTPPATDQTQPTDCLTSMSSNTILSLNTSLIPNRHLTDILYFFSTPIGRKGCKGHQCHHRGIRDVKDL
jgi:hypothetical protein